MNNLITASYTDQFNVSFTNDAWFNATDVAKHFGKRPTDWLKLDSTQEYIGCLCELIRSEKSALLKVKRGGRGKGDSTWFHPKLAVAFARWLDVRFSIWCDLQIEKILLSTVPVTMSQKRDSITLNFSPPKEHEPTRQIMINIHHSGLLDMWETPPETVEEKRNLAIIALKQAGYVVIKGTLVA